MPFVNKDVYGSTLHSHVHKGPNQAGNKSLISYRIDKGIPGYTGFIPTPAAVPIPIKFVERTGKPADASTQERLTTKTAGSGKDTEYTDRFNKVPSDTRVTEKTGGGYALHARSTTPLSVIAPALFIATTTYRAEVMNGSDLAKEQLNAVNGLSNTLCVYESARRVNTANRAAGIDPISLRGRNGRVQTVNDLKRQKEMMTTAAAAAAPFGIPEDVVAKIKGIPAADQMSAGVGGAGGGWTASNTKIKNETLDASKGSWASPLGSSSPAVRQQASTVLSAANELVGYQTSYNSMNNRAQRVMDGALRRSLSASAGNAKGAISNASLTGGSDGALLDFQQPRFATLPRVMAPTMYGNRTTNQIDYGEESSDPMSRQAATADAMTKMSTTTDLASGTSRVSKAIPGFAGHIASSPYANDVVRKHSQYAVPRASVKESMILHDLHQYPRGRVPGYTGFKPMANANIQSVQPANLPSTATTKGEADIRTTGYGIPVRESTHSHHNNSQAGIMSFFSGSTIGTESISDNGLFNAQVFYNQVRPLEALPKVQRPSKLTVYGAGFKDSNSLV
eukprot:CAMPEP_0175080316 /NCGR_PEP_ID=MMETSP0052_2-20121109/25429_1 /TAXON_ID=51329 ORGANISM="Polytomella parva, Strain SAG 63-3" /NCGR_SAMPLE_ID=MMETSP0052_2 /ASSEMBLY_ACC=CAM_ASM_000194 /LENGTH=564 /DNA_ID=CAMNT_0016350981 /DNA_START=11 /DNA_END=1705 /DNA_ORIENTATION=+